jgi:hypothetical protein
MNRAMPYGSVNTRRYRQKPQIAITSQPSVHLLHLNEKDFQRATQLVFFVAGGNARVWRPD